MLFESGQQVACRLRAQPSITWPQFHQAVSCCFWWFCRMSERLEPIECIQFSLGSFVHIVLLHDLRWFLVSPCFYHFCIGFPWYFCGAVFWTVSELLGTVFVRITSFGAPVFRVDLGQLRVEHWMCWASGHPQNWQKRQLQSFSVNLFCMNDTCRKRSSKHPNRRILV